eukprot:jgi/Tetstr1/432403/TSEL_021800.t1
MAPTMSSLTRRGPDGAGLRLRPRAIRTGLLILLLGSVAMTLLLLDVTDRDGTGQGGLRVVEEAEGDGGEGAAGAWSDVKGSEGEGEEGEGGEGEEGEEQEEGESDARAAEDADGGRRPPEIINIEPFHGPAAGGLTLTVHGRFFMGVGEWTSSAFVNGRRCTSSDVLNYETLLCGLPQGVGGSLSVVVQKTVGGKVLSSPDNTLFSYDAPVVERLAPDHSPTGGGITITVFGANFGQPDAGSGTAQAPEVLIGDAPCADVVLRSDNELICVAPPGSGGGAPVQVSVGAGPHRVESHRARSQFAYMLSPKEKMQQESSMLLDGLQVRYSSLPVFLHKAGLTGLNEFLHKDLFTGRTIAYSVTPDLMELLPKEDVKQQHRSCAVVLNGANLMRTSLGADIDGADAVLRFNNAPTEGFSSEVGKRTTYRLLQTEIVRSMIQKVDLDAARHAWRPQQHERLVMLSEYAQDLFVLLHRAFPSMDLLLPSAALLGNINTLYAELRRRFTDMGIDEELAREAEEVAAAADAEGGGAAGEARRRLAQISMARLAHLAEQQNELKEVEPAAGIGVAPPGIVGTLLAVQMCQQVEVFGFDAEALKGAAGKEASAPAYYYSQSRAGMGVFDVGNGRAPELDAEMLPIDAAIVELLEIAGFLRIRS